MTVRSAPEQTVTTSDDRVLHAAVPAHLGRYRGQSRLHTGSDLKIFLTWWGDQSLDPLRVGRADIERYVRWLQEIRYADLPTCEFHRRVRPPSS
jgi:integrase/recombinase XerD